MDKIINSLKEDVAKILASDNSGHGMDHINRVLNLSLKFSLIENANANIVALIALLHDVDDYKLFGFENALLLSNAKALMDKYKIKDAIKNEVCSALMNIGYSKRLNGMSPSSLEGKIVSDADMCDAMGVNGVIRAYTYSMKNGKPFFDKNKYPVCDIDVKEYTTRCSSSSVCHMFEKILKLKDLMLTEAGKKEALKRHEIVVDMLYHLFEEEDSIEWKEYLDKYLALRN